ncbi:MAG: hypothetical protein LC776_04850, partial [Acidobacteria bacterium]|nr:hypothetical protein [Acidobacteriota bacterium]
MVSTPTLRPYFATGNSAPVTHRPSRPASLLSLANYATIATLFHQGICPSQTRWDALRETDSVRASSSFHKLPLLGSDSPLINTT